MGYGKKNVAKRLAATVSLAFDVRRSTAATAVSALRREARRERCKAHPKAATVNTP